MSDLHTRLNAMLQANGSMPSLADEITSAPSDYSDENLARRFSDQHKDALRYVETWGKWLVWDGTRWKPDETLVVVDFSRKLAHEASSEILAQGGKPGLAKGVASARTISAIEQLARADRRHASRTEDWDRDPWLLNTPTGTVDLRTGQLRPHNPNDLITKITAVGPGGDCPRWLKFLNRIFDGDSALISYVQQVLGYSLTGSIQEHALFFCYGTGGNGKGVLLETWQSIQADYTVVAPIATFTASDHERHPTELAMMRGARSVVTQETEDGQRWAEAKIKALTGGDPITARFMRGDFFTFQPSFKLIIAGNQKPSLRNVDEAIKRRFNLLPFTVTIPTEERDPELADKLKEEWPGVLAWAVEGCLEWQRIGLAPPKAVTEATENYLIEEDAVGRFIAEKCERHPQAQVSLKDLYAAWKEYSEASGERFLSEKVFSQKLESPALSKGQDSRTRRVFFRGIRLRPKDIPDIDWSTPVPDAWRTER